MVIFMIRHFQVWFCGAVTEDLWRLILLFVSVPWKKEINIEYPVLGLTTYKL